MQMSPHGIEFVMEWEEYRPVIYRDVGGIPTLGYGHVHSGGHKISLTRPEAVALLKQDLNFASREVTQVVKQPLTQNEFDALVSFEFNTGQLRESTLLVKLNKHEFNQAINVELGRWVYCKGRKIKGLINRRNAERKLFFS